MTHAMAADDVLPGARPEAVAMTEAGGKAGAARAGLPALAINARYLTQPFSGVQRFATEMTRALQECYPADITLLGPPGADAATPGLKVVGSRGGQIWEQMQLPGHTDGRLLVNWGNIAPMRVRRQIVVLHDAGVFSTPEAYSASFRLWYKTAQRMLLLGGTHVVTVSEFARRELSRNLGIPAARMDVIPEGGDHMDRVVADPSVLPTLPFDRFVIAVGNLAAHKNLRALGELAKRLHAANVGLVIVGGKKAKVLQQLDPSAMPNPAHFVGNITDGQLKALYQAAICLVVPSRYEGFGLPVVEAMASGCALVASDIPAFQETCRDAALFADPADQGQIADQVMRFVTDDDLRQQRRMAGLAVANGFTWARAANAFVDVLARRYAQPTDPGTSPRVSRT